MSAPCTITAGGMHQTPSSIAGTCSTLMRPNQARAKAAIVVVLSESWAQTDTASFTFVITRSGEVLAEKVSGQPPQLWK